MSQTEFVIRDGQVTTNSNVTGACTWFPHGPPPHPRCGRTAIWEFQHPNGQWVPICQNCAETLPRGMEIR